MYSCVFNTPCSILVAGPTQSGKTSLVYRMLREKKRLFVPAPTRTILIYKEHQKLYRLMKKHNLIQHMVSYLPALADLKKLAKAEQAKGGALMVIFDDQLMETTKNMEYLEAWSVSCHHLNMTLLFLAQQIFFDSPMYRSLSLNSQCFILMKNPRDLRSVTTLASRMYPHHSKFMVEAYKEATKSSYGYILVDFQQATPEHLRLRTNIFVSERPMVTYLENNST